MEHRLLDTVENTYYLNHTAQQTICFAGNTLIPIVQNFDGGNFDEGNFDEYRLFKYLKENILMDDHCLSPYICKRFIVFKQFDRLNFDCLARRCQKCQNPPSKFCTIW